MGAGSVKKRQGHLWPVVPFIVQCLYEAQEKADCESELGRSKVKSSASASPSVLDSFAVGYCIAVSRSSHLGPELVAP